MARQWPLTRGCRRSCIALKAEDRSVSVRWHVDVFLGAMILLLLWLRAAGMLLLLWLLLLCWLLQLSLLLLLWLLY